MDASAQRQLESLLDLEIGVARELARVLEQERSALTGTTPDAVSRVAAEKIRLFEQLERMERERRSLCEQAPAIVGSPNTLLTHFTSAVADRWQSLMGLVAACRDANSINGLIVNLRQAQVRQLIDVVRGSTAPATYNPQGLTPARALRPLARA